MKQFNSFLSGFFASTASLLGKMITADSLMVRNSYQNRKNTVIFYYYYCVDCDRFLERGTNHRWVCFSIFTV